MSIFLPYNTSVVIEYFSSLLNLDLSSLSNYEVIVLTLFSNLYFFVFWFIILYFTFKGFNKIYQKLF